MPRVHLSYRSPRICGGDLLLLPHKGVGEKLDEGEATIKIKIHEVRKRSGVREGFVRSLLYLKSHKRLTIMPGEGATCILAHFHETLL
jgi:hypothetical protein